MSGTLPASEARTPAQFLYIAELRRKESWTLLRGKHWLGAFYLAGYTFECVLKAVLAKNAGGRLPPDYLTHDIDVLRRAVLPLVSATSAVALQAVPAWTHLLRYDCRAPRADTVVRFLNSVKEAYRCLSTYL